MAKASLPIPPFPEDIDRRSFGGWLSGFSDGEACFQLLFTTHKTPAASFTIALRRDDNDILGTIRSFWGCGRLFLSQRTLNGKKFFVTIYMAQRIDDLTRVIVPHFEHFPLLSKKRHDVELWKQGVALISSRDHRGLHRRWTDSEIEYFTSLHDALREGRKFNALRLPPLPPPPPLPPEEDYPLFG